MRDLATGIDTTYLANPGQGLLWSPDASEIYALADDVIVSLDGGAPRSLVPDMEFFTPTVWGIDGLYGITVAKRGSEFSRIQSLARMNPTTGHVEMLRNPSESYRPGFLNQPVPRVGSGTGPAGGTLRFVDISPDASEALVFDQDRTEHFYLCEAQPEDCPDFTAPGCFGFQTFSGGEVAGACLNGHSFARMQTTGGGITRPSGWVGTNLGTHFGIGLTIPLAYTPDGETVVAEYTGDERLQTWDGYSIKVEGEPTVLFQDSGPAGGERVNVTWTAKTLAVPVTDRPGEFSGPSTSISFGAPAGNPDGVFECSRDGGIFLECESPLQLTDLTEGEHVVRIRFVPDVGAAGPADGRALDRRHDAAGASSTPAPSGVRPVAERVDRVLELVDRHRPLPLQARRRSRGAVRVAVRGRRAGGRIAHVQRRRGRSAGLRSSPPWRSWEVKRPARGGAAAARPRRPARPLLRAVAAVGREPVRLRAEVHRRARRWP